MQQDKVYQIMVEQQSTSQTDEAASSSQATEHIYPPTPPQSDHKSPQTPHSKTPSTRQLSPVPEARRLSTEWTPRYSKVCLLLIVMFRHGSWIVLSAVLLIFYCGMMMWYNVTSTGQPKGCCFYYCTVICHCARTFFTSV